MEPAENPTPPARSAVSLPLPLLIGIVLGVALLVGGGSVAAFMLLKPGDATAAEQTDETLVADVEAAELPESGEAFYTIEDPFIVNLESDSTADYIYLKFAISLEVKNTAAADALAAKLPKIKALINRTMNGVAYGSISTEAGQRKYSSRIRDTLNEALTPPPNPKTGEPGAPPVINSYFTTLVAQ